LPAVVFLLFEGCKKGDIMGEYYEFHLDESGTFGDWIDPNKAESQEETEVRVVGGVIVPDHLIESQEKLKNDMQEIRKKYFPAGKKVTDIHISELKDKQLQKNLRREILEFFKNHMKDAQIAFIYHRRLADEETSVPGAQLYRNMLFHLLQIVLLYHPFFPDDSKALCKISHRRFAYPAKFEEYLAGQGYLKLVNSRSGQTQLTAVQPAETENLMASFARALRFKSARHQSFEAKPYEQFDSPFMVMADWICNALLGIVSNNEREKDIEGALRGYLGRDKVLFFCSSDYELPETLLSTYYQGRNDRFLAGYLRREKHDQIPDRFLLYPAYQKIMNKLKEGVTPLNDEQCETLVGIADGFLQDRLYGRLSDVKELITILGSHMDKIMTEAPNAKRDRLAWRYHDAALRYANHTGNTKLGRIHYKKGSELFNRLPDKSIEDVRAFHEFVNRSSIISANEFAFRRGCDLLAAVEEKEAHYTNMFSNASNEIYGKICGTLAQNYAFMKDSKKAQQYFQIAAEHLVSEKNKKMQASFRAHFALDQGEKDQYFTEVCELLKQSTFPGFQKAINTCFSNLSDSDNVFLLHLVLKGLLSYGDEDDRKYVLNKFSSDMGFNYNSRVTPGSLFLLS
jgi:hypothetical protein